MAKITLSLIEELDNQIDLFTDKELNKAFEKLESQQPYLNSYIDATQEIFEDEEEFLDMVNYFHLLINMAFEKAFGPIDLIPSDLIEEIDNKMLNLIDSFEEGEDDDFNEKISAIFETHPQSELINYFFTTLFDEEADYDDHIVELGTQLMLFTYGVIDIYSKFVNS